MRTPGARPRRHARTTTHGSAGPARAAATAVVAGAVMLLPACSLLDGDGDGGSGPAAATTPGAGTPGAAGADPTAPPEPTRTVGGRFLLGRWPLTGNPARGRAPQRPVTIVKVDNTSSSAPQLGLGAADLVVEELVEGGTTRLAAFYYQRLPGVVGPVRSLRGTDIPVVRAAGDPVVVASGGAPPTVRRFDRAGVRTRSEGAQGFFRAGDRVAPYNLMVRLPDLLRSVPARRSVPAAYLPWGDGAVKGPRARRVTATFSASRSTLWEYRGGRYQPLNGYQSSESRFVPTTVLALRVRLGDAGYLDPAGNPVPETKLVGRGAAWVFHGGRVQKARWVKRSQAGPLRLQTRSGKPLTVPAGRTWVELVPGTGGSVSWAARR